MFYFLIGEPRINLFVRLSVHPQNASLADWSAPLSRMTTLDGRRFGLTVLTSLNIL